MPRFHLHIYNSIGFVEDEEGQDLPSLDGAKAAAVEGARSLLSTEILAGNIDLRGRIEVMDERGGHLATVQFRDVVQIKTGDLGTPEDEKE